jgi:hypothetical protein
MAKLEKRQIYAIVGTVAVLSVITFIVIRRNKNKLLIKQITDILDSKIKDPSAPQGQVILSKEELNKLPVGNFPLKVGDKNQKVGALQTMLNKNYGTKISVDGKFGVELYKILCDKYFNYGCSVVGVVNMYKRTISSADFDEISKHKN